MDKKEKKLLFEIEEIVVGLSAIAMMISVFLPWGKATGYSASGWGGDGKILICLGAVALILLIMDQIYKISAWIPLFLGLVALTIGTIDFNAMQKAVMTFDGKVGSGLYTVLAASLGIVVGSIIDLIRNRKK